MNKENAAILPVVLQKQFKTQLEASSEIINLKAILDLPKPTEHFLSDLHGEFYAFQHMIKNSSGLIKNKIEQEFSNEISPNEKDNLAICIFYPQELLAKMKDKSMDFPKWQVSTIKNLIRVTRVVSRKYTRSKVRKSLPEKYCYIIEELLYETDHGGNKKKYYDSIVNNIIDIGLGESFIAELCRAIQRLSVDCLHIVGDIYDRGPYPHKIVEELMKHHSVDIQWGNHDISWIGAASGSKVCIANVIRICARYGHMDVIEEGYGINLRKLYEFAAKTYENDDCKSFEVKTGEDFSEHEKDLMKRLHKAITIMQFKLEGQLIKRHPEYNMEGRLLLDKIRENNKLLELSGQTYELNDTNFPTLDPKAPYELTGEEKAVADKLQTLFMNNEKLTKHVEFLMKKGNMYLIYNNNLLLHGCIPMDGSCEFSSFELDGRKASGKELLDLFEEKIRQIVKKRDKSDSHTDVFWYLWSGEHSPLFGKKEMKTFERYFLNDKSTHKEELNPYYSYWDDEWRCFELIKEFGVDDEFAHIINGHVPVRAKSGENPLKAGGKLIVIDGGLNPVYNPITGTAGYTLIYDSYGLLLAAHEKFVSKENIIDKEKDIVTYFSQCDRVNERKRVKDTDIGKKIAREISELEQLLEAYKQGKIKEE